MTESEMPIRPIRSYVLRAGRLTTAQRNALENLMPTLGLEVSATDPAAIDLGQVFGRSAPLTLEIGFGDGEALLQMASENPESDFIGVEVHPPGVGHLLLRLEQNDLQNVRVINSDALDALRWAIPDSSVDKLCLFFPDPWPKKKHHKRRILNTEFLGLIHKKMKPGGIFHFATDWKDYACCSLELLDACPSFVNQAGTGNFSPRPDNRPLTKFEKRGKKLGHEVWDIVVAKIPG